MNNNLSGKKVTALDNDCSADEILSRYHRAQRLEQGNNTKNIAFNTTLTPQWIGDSDCFWYIRDSKAGQEYRLVDANKDCDMLLLPKCDHRMASGYVMRRMWDYLVTHLLECEPPKDFTLTRGLEIIYPGCLE